VEYEGMSNMIFYAEVGGKRIYELEIPHDNEPVHLPDLAKLGLSGFQSSHPEISVREDSVLFGFDRT
jgi:hypothetical protein